MSEVNGVEVVLPPPPGYVVDFENPQRQYVRQYHGVYTGGMILMVLFVAQNLYVRWWIQRRFIDPATICLIVAFASSATCQSTTLWWFNMPVVGVHSWEIPKTQFIFFLKAFTIQAAFFNLVTGFAKLSILLFYRQLSPQKWWRWAIHGTSFIVIGYCISLFFAVLFACNPMHKAWDVDMVGGSCIDILSMFKATASFGIVTDLVILALPFPLILKLHMKTAQKIGIIFVFVIGSATFITSIIRLSLLFSKEFSSPDKTWDMSYTIIWAIIEIQLLVICPSLCTLRAFGRHFAPRLMGDSSKRTTHAYTNNRYRKSFRTIPESQSSRKPGKFPDTDDDAVFLRSFGREPHEVRVEGHIRGRSNGAESPSSGETGTWDPRIGDDMERGIIQTKVITITNTPA